MIVIVTRDDLRDEFTMADEAFALSPISARAALPSEQDYDAISEAFMETSRGRWFLGEYAKRNRNADTRMVLDAVARIEESLAAQKQPAPESGLKQALIAIGRAVHQAQAAATAVDGEIPETGTRNPPPELAVAAPEATDTTSEAAEAYDDAMLDLIALEMAAPDARGPDDGYPERDRVPVLEAPPADPVGVAAKPAPMAAPPQPAAIQTSHPVSREPSLGSALIANGIVRRPDVSGPDPLAPIRRMSQAEKIA